MYRLSCWRRSSRRISPNLTRPPLFAKPAPRPENRKVRKRSEANGVVPKGRPENSPGRSPKDGVLGWAVRGRIVPQGPLRFPHDIVEQVAFSRPFGTSPEWMAKPRTVVLGYFQVAPSGPDFLRTQWLWQASNAPSPYGRGAPTVSRLRRWGSCRGTPIPVLTRGLRVCVKLLLTEFL